MAAGTTVVLAAAQIDPRALQAYDSYAARARQVFISEIQLDHPRIMDGDAALRAGTIAARAGREDGIIDVDGGLIHHWAAAAFLPGASLDDVLTLAGAVDQYPSIYKSITAARVLGRSGDRMRVKIRLEERAGIVNATLDISSEVEYVRLDEHRAYSVSEAVDIREVADAGKSGERLLTPGEDHGYLWRAHTFARYVAGEGGVYAELETIGLSRGFPPLTGWIIEPIARRLGRKSVQGSLQEFREGLTSRLTN